MGDGVKLIREKRESVPLFLVEQYFAVVLHNICSRILHVFKGKPIYTG